MAVPMPELAVVFEMTAIELTCLPHRQQALENLADRSRVARRWRLGECSPSD